MYYDSVNKVPISGNELKRMGLENESCERLAELGIYRLEIIRPELGDPAVEGIVPAGDPYPSEENPFVWIQQMAVFNFLDHFKEQKKAELASRRWEAQIANYIMDDGTIFKTTPEDRLQLSALVQSMQSNGRLAADFKAASGWLTASLAKLKYASDRITAYIEECFTNERRLSEAIDAATTIEELNAVDIQSGWPENAPKQPEQPELPDNPNETVEPIEPDETAIREKLEKLAAQKADEARIVADAVVVPYMSEFSDVERQTWAKQQAEVAAYLADNSAPTPTLDGLAKARGISREAMLEKAIAKVTAFEPLSVAIVGRQQKYEDAIRALANDESKTLQARIVELEGMTFSYGAGEDEIAEMAS